MKFPQWLSLAILLACGVLLWRLRDLLIHLFAGIVLAMAICTLVNQLRSRWRMPRLIALTICLTSLLLIICTALALIVPPFTEEFQQIIRQLPEAGRKLWVIALSSISQISSLVYGNNALEQSWTTSDNLFTFPDSTSLASGVSQGIQKILGIAGNLGNGLIQFIFVISIALMISIQPKSYREVAIQLVPSFYRRRARKILLECGNSLSDWMVGVLISSICVALLAGIGLSVLGVKLVMANAILAGILNIIPNVGPTISTIFPISVALLDAPWKAVAVVGLYVLIQNLESYLITPSVMQHQVKLLPGLTLTAQFTFAILFGPLGLFLALPLAVVLQVMIREILIHDLLDPWKKKLREQ
ncbi:AI-2E family transporter [Prochlorococcus sp. MIT 1341]|uniref:AI-2E family transporter n=1 Tax=Prochlorococcus sp. MIT 1341 TaxID=3096221 RepID=UPI002A75245C|nr:AI-2E family transporter [Prochlorococcus sp. MIT 1341]